MRPLDSSHANYEIDESRLEEQSRQSEDGAFNAALDDIDWAVAEEYVEVNASHLADSHASEQYESERGRGEVEPLEVSHGGDTVLCEYSHVAKSFITLLNNYLDIENT